MGSLFFNQKVGIENSLDESKYCLYLLGFEERTKQTLSQFILIIS